MSLEKRSTEELRARKKDLEYLAMMAKVEQLELGEEEASEHAAIVRELARRESRPNDRSSEDG